MRMRLVAAGFMVLAGGCVSADLLACGDKFLVLSRGTRFERAPVARQNVGILLFANPSSRLPDAIQRMSVEATLRKAGYRPLSVVTADEFERALQAGGWDLILLDLADAPAAASRVAGPGAPEIVPVAVGVSNDALSRARKQYARVIASPTNGQAFVDALDRVVVLKLKGKANRAAGTTR
jgi:hypothetical protein